MAIALDASANSTYQAVSAGYSFNHTCTGQNLLLLVGVALFGAGTVSGITYNGVAMTLVRRESGTTYVAELWQLVAPATGTHSIAVTLSGALTSVSESVSFTGVDQGSPTTGNNGAHNTGAIAQNNITTTIANSYVAGVISTMDTTIASTSGTQDQNVSGVLGSGGFSHLGPIANPSSNGLSWSLSGTNPYALSGCAINPLVVPFVDFTNDVQYLEQSRMVPY